jgi:hypothetical protein
MRKTHWAIAAVIFTILSFANNVGCDSSSSNDEEIDRLKNQIENLQIENEKLRENLRVLTMLSGHRATPKSKPEMEEPAPEWTPEQLLTAYFTVKWWQERIPMVLDPNIARPRMAETYKGWTEEQLKNYYFKIHPITTAWPEVGGELKVLVDCGNEVNVPYYLTRTVKGFRIHWTKTMDELKEAKKQKFLNDWSLVDAQVFVSVVRREQSSSYAKLHVALKNASNAYITYVNSSCVVRNETGRYLGNTYIVEELPPRAEKIAEFLFMEMNVSDIRKWRFILDGATIQDDDGDTLHNAHRYIKLVEKRY